MYCLFISSEFFLFCFCFIWVYLRTNTSASYVFSEFTTIYFNSVRTWHGTEHMENKQRRWKLKGHKGQMDRNTLWTTDEQFPEYRLVLLQVVSLAREFSPDESLVAEIISVELDTEWTGVNCKAEKRYLISSIDTLNLCSLRILDAVTHSSQRAYHWTWKLSKSADERDSERADNMKERAAVLNAHVISHD